MKPKRL